MAANINGMKKKFFCFTTLLFIASTFLVQAQKVNSYKPDFSTPKTIPGYKLVWHDEFNINGKPDTTNWIYEHGFVRNEELQWYTANNAYCSNGILQIQGRKERTENNRYDSLSNHWQGNRKYAEYTSSSIQTRGHQQWLYGRFEIRARIDTAMGAWPAIWTLGTKKEWPENGEIDIMEFYRIKDVPTILANVAWGTEKRFVAKWHTERTPLAHFTQKDPEWVKKFHVWRMDWTKDSITLYLDDELLNATSLNSTINADGTNAFAHPQYLLLNLALGGNGGEPVNAEKPVSYEVDYVRVYQKK